MRNYLKRNHIRSVVLLLSFLSSCVFEFLRAAVNTQVSPLLLTETVEVVLDKLKPTQYNLEIPAMVFKACTNYNGFRNDKKVRKHVRNKH